MWSQILLHEWSNKELSMDAMCISLIQCACIMSLNISFAYYCIFDTGLDVMFNSTSVSSACLDENIASYISAYT